MTITTSIRVDGETYCQWNYLKTLAVIMDKNEPSLTELVRKSVDHYLNHIDHLIKTCPEEAVDEFSAIAQLRKPRLATVPAKAIKQELLSGGVKPYREVRSKLSRKRFDDLLEGKLDHDHD